MFSKLNLQIEQMKKLKKYEVFIVFNKMDCIPVQEREEKIKFLKTQLLSILPSVIDANNCFHELSCKEFFPRDFESLNWVKELLSHLSNFMIDLIRIQQVARLSILEYHFGPLNQFLSVADHISNTPVQNRTVKFNTIQEEYKKALEQVEQYINKEMADTCVALREIIDKHVDGYFSQIDFLNQVKRYINSSSIEDGLSSLRTKLNNEIVSYLKERFSGASSLARPRVENPYVYNFVIGSAVSLLPGVPFLIMLSGVELMFARSNGIGEKSVGLGTLVGGISLSFLLDNPIALSLSMTALAIDSGLAPLRKHLTRSSFSEYKEKLLQYYEVQCRNLLEERKRELNINFASVVYYGKVFKDLTREQYLELEFDKIREQYKKAWSNFLEIATGMITYPIDPKTISKKNTMFSKGAATISTAVLKNPTAVQNVVMEELIISEQQTREMCLNEIYTLS